MKKCPFCAERIKDEALVCRYCGRDLPHTMTSQHEIMDKASTPIYRYWMQMIKKPTPSTFSLVAESGNLTLTKIVLPILVLGYIHYSIWFFSTLGTLASSLGSFGLIIYFAGCLFPTFTDTAVMLIGFAITYGITRLFSSKNTYTQLAFTMGSAYVVFLFVSIIISTVEEITPISISGGPAAGYFTLLFFILDLIIVIGVSKVKWWQSLIAVVPGFLFPAIQELLFIRILSFVGLNVLLIFGAG